MNMLWKLYTAFGREMEVWRTQGTDFDCLLCVVGPV